MTVAQSAKPFNSNITMTLKRLIALLEEDEADDYGILQPSQPAFKLAMQLVIDAYEAMYDSFPKASASTDEQGSIRLTWSKQAPERKVCLVCPAHTDQKAYLYHELEDNYAVERDVTASTLVHWLGRLNQG